MCCRASCLEIDEKFIGYIGILIGSDYIIGYIGGIRENVPFPIVVLSLLFSGALVASSVLLVFGVSNQKKHFVLPFLIVNVLFLLRLIVVFILNMISGSIVLFVLFIVNSAFWSYCGLCILSFYRKIGTLPSTNVGA
ncbi:unnamed protein product [Hermetia illucens]|uniref:Uncharacterized protein n=1 Tax=Hermetia illucens TaxID=343691 RepID=A0A7R8YY66_HERIL|nr:uncharacterized protein LOC119657693 [Hermetia illucens]CAD7089763.1 unnamed protein product [Hermetia illucens]